MCVATDGGSDAPGDVTGRYEVSAGAFLTTDTRCRTDTRLQLT
jgi:hypothetical protein